MAQKTEVVLRNAVNRIKAGKGSKARQSLVELLRREPDNAQAWYLLSFTLEDPQRQQYALRQALRVTPDFEKARGRLNKLRGESTVSSPIPSTPSLSEPFGEPSAPSEMKSIPAFFDGPKETSFQDGAPAETEVKEQASGPRKRFNFLPVLLTILLIGLVIFAAWVFLPGLIVSPPTETPVASRTLPATWTPTAVEPSSTPTSSQTPMPTSTPTQAVSPSAEDTSTP